MTNKEAFKALTKLSQAINDAYDFEPELLDDWGFTEAWDRLERYISRTADGDDDDEGETKSLWSIEDTYDSPY